MLLPPPPGAAPPPPGAWPGLVGERLERFRPRMVTCYCGDPEGQAEAIEAALLDVIPAGPHGTEEARRAFFAPATSLGFSEAGCGSGDASPLAGSPSRPGAGPEEGGAPEGVATLEGVAARVDAVIASCGLRLRVGSELAPSTGLEEFFAVAAVEPHEFWMSIENEFGMEVPDRDARTLQQIRAVYRC